MFRQTRGFHRWVGILLFPFLLLIAATGFLLATKSTCGFVRPPEADGIEIASLAETITLERAAESVFALGIAELNKREDIDRIDYRPRSNVFKIVSKEGYHEVQVDGKSGEILSVAKRFDQFTEDLHDLSFFSKMLNRYWLPIVAVSLFALTIAGGIIFVTPMIRRAKFRKQQRLKD